MRCCFQFFFRRDHQWQADMVWYGFDMVLCISHWLHHGFTEGDHEKRDAVCHRAGHRWREGTAQSAQTDDSVQMLFGWQMGWDRPTILSSGVLEGQGTQFRTCHGSLLVRTMGGKGLVSSSSNKNRLLRPPCQPKHRSVDCAALRRSLNAATESTWPYQSIDDVSTAFWGQQRDQYRRQGDFEKAGLQSAWGSIETCSDRTTVVFDPLHVEHWPAC